MVLRFFIKKIWLRGNKPDKFETKSSTLFCEIFQDISISYFTYLFRIIFVFRIIHIDLLE